MYIPEIAKELIAQQSDQLNIAWQLLIYHFNGLENREGIWQPAEKGLALNWEENGWKADWPDSETYVTGPPNIACILWYILYWWSMALNSSGS